MQPQPCSIVIPELSFYKEKKKNSTIAFESEEFRRHGMIVRHPEQQLLKSRKGKQSSVEDMKISYFKCIRSDCPTHRPLACFFLLSSFTGNIDLLFTQRRELEDDFCFAVDKLFLKKIFNQML